MGFRSTSDLRGLLTTRVDDITDAANLSVPFHSGLRGIGVVLERRIERQLCVKDWLLSRPSNTPAFSDEVVLGGGMIDFC